MDNCIFCKIGRGDIPSKKVYEDENVIAFHDMHPIAPVHFLLVPKAHIASLADCGIEQENLLGSMLMLGARLAKEQGLDAGFRTMINTGKGGGQEIFHLHIHIFGGGSTLPKT